MNKKPSCKINGFKYPAADKLSSRTSTICRSMACTMLKRESCSPEEEKLWMEFFPEKKCAYCGKPASHLDHLYALIENRRPTGYGTEPANLVPCCRVCNQRKGNLDWKEYMRSDKCEHVVDSSNDISSSIENRIKTIESFQEKMPASKAIIDKETEEKWAEILSSFDAKLNDAQEQLLLIKEKIYK